jgi:FkbM family methyltransferase
MKLVDAWYVPDRDTHFEPWMRFHQQRRDGRLCYQLHKYTAAMTSIAQRRVAVDVGAHVGFWSYWMAQDFEVLHAFEPMANLRECWRANVPDRDGVTLHPEALGAFQGTVGVIETVDNSGNARIDAAPGTVPMMRLDDFALPVVDFLKVDCEGYEAFVIEGAIETIQRCHPAVLVEQKRKCGFRYGRVDDAAVRLLTAIGAQLKWSLGGDYFLTFQQEAA